MATLKNILTASSMALLITACGSKNRMGLGSVNQSPRYNQVMLAGTYAGALPQLNITNSGNGPTESPSTPSAVTNQPALNQTAQDFGYLNDCYRKISQQSSSYFQMGIGADSIFQGAGQALAKCYNELIKARTQQQQQQQQQWQAYQNYVYQQSYANSMGYANQLLQQQQQSSATQFSIPRPPGATR